MSCSNFKLQKDFRLYLFDDSNISEIEREYIFDNFPYYHSAILHKYKRSLKFFTIELRDGYYSGLQLYVEPDSDLKYLDFNNLTNCDTRYAYDMSKTEFLRKYNSEINFINKKLLPQLAECLGFKEYSCIGIFSNGEAIYEEIK